MAKGFKHGGGGGIKEEINPLNFTVTAYPSEVELNTTTPEGYVIGVVTTNPIRGWHFASEQPVNMAEGALWFSTDKSGAVSFNALKENTIAVYPKSAKQMVSGKLVDVIAKSWQNGAWVDWWNGELYDSGNEYTNITGGWLLTSNGNYNLDTDAKKENDSFYLEVSASTSALFITQSPIDVSNYKTLKLNCFNGSSNATDIRAGLISTNSSSHFYDNMDVYGGLVADGTVSIDIESVSGKFYVCIAEWSKSGSYKVNISKIWLE